MCLVEDVVVVIGGLNFLLGGPAWGPPLRKLSGKLLNVGW